ncbi:MAG: hypothetical protein VX969_03065, partial [Verrucomicrobiota bacterium]|nr:hypothetical protein [Verrucomicrobiota bacterium]
MKTQRTRNKSFNLSLASFRRNANGATRLAAFLVGLAFLGSPIAKATVEKGAKLQGSKLQDDTSLLKFTTHKAIKWSSADFDPSTFEHPTGNPTRLKFKAAGDYFISLTAPIVEGPNGNNGKRSQQEFVIAKNGTVLDVGAARSTYIRHDSGHGESSGHTAVLLRGISANDYIEIKTKRVHNQNHHDTFLGLSTLFVEKVESSRTIFSGTATRTVAGTNLNGNAVSPLQWTAGAKDSGFTHSDSSNSQNVTLDAAGKYMVYVNVPLDGTPQRSSVKMMLKLNGTQVTGGQASQGYIRWADGIRDASIHWAGLVTTTSANRVLTVDVGKDANGGTVTINGEKATIFVEKLANADSLLSVTGNTLV